jgi:hypothetical protein
MSNLLFDISPEEMPDNGKKKQRKRAADEPQKEPEKPVFAARAPVGIVAIGKLDGVHACDNESCRGSAHDILYEDFGEWMIQCCFCNWTQWVPVIEGYLKQEFRLTEGIFAGMALREIAEQKNGIEYIKLSAKKHKSDRVRDECAAWLDQDKSCA